MEVENGNSVPMWQEEVIFFSLGFFPSSLNNFTSCIIIGRIVSLSANFFAVEKFAPSSSRNYVPLVSFKYGVHFIYPWTLELGRFNKIQNRFSFLQDMHVPAKKVFLSLI